MFTLIRDIHGLFELLIADLFQEEGLILMNSGDPGIKKLETGMFQQILKHNHELAKAVSDQQLSYAGSRLSPDY